MSRDLRTLLKDSYERLDEEEREELQELAMQMWRDAMGAEKTMWSYCPDCRCKVQADFPDHGARLKAIEVLANQAYGKPQESKVVTVDIGELTLEALGRLSTLELAQAAGLDVVDGEFLELPPAT